jgi:hypothetical protein
MAQHPVDHPPILKKNTLFVFDFDGVLAIPYTNPEELFPGVHALLEELRTEGHRIAVCSFNPRAYISLEHLLIAGPIDAIRAGSKHKWWEQGDGNYSDALHRQEMNKGLHIWEMIESEELEEFANGAPIERLFFIDDDPKNIWDVIEHAHAAKWPFPVGCDVVGSYVGLTRHRLVELGFLPAIQ